VLLHDFKSGARLAGVPADGAVRAALHFCPLDGDLLAAAGEDGSVAVWSVKGRTLQHDLRRLHRVRLAGSGGARRSGRTWGAQRRFPALDGAPACSRHQCGNLAPFAAAASSDLPHAICHLLLLQGGATGVRFAPDSPSVLYTCGSDMRLLAVDTRAPPGQQEAAAMHAPAPLACLDARFDGRSVATGTAGGGVVVFDLRRPGPPSVAYSFSEQGPVRCVRWQNAPHVSSKHKAAAAASASIGTVAPAASGQLGGRPALSGAATTPTSGIAPGAFGSAAAANGRGNGGGGLIAAARPGGGAAAGRLTPEAARGASPEPSHASELSLVRHGQAPCRPRRARQLLHATDGL
jgi:hypothetical protein